MRTFILLSMPCAALFTALPVMAADLRTGDRVEIAADMIVNDDLYVAARDVVIDGVVRGDLVAVGANVLIRGNVDGSIIAAGGTVTMDGQAGRAARALGADVNINGVVGTDIVIACGECNLGVRSRAGTDLIAAGGTLTLAGNVTKNARLVGENIRFGSAVGNEVRLQAGNLDVEPSATAASFIHGVRERISIASGAQLAHRERVPVSLPSRPGPFPGLLFTALSALLAGAVVRWAWPDRALQPAHLVAEQPGRALLSGLALAALWPLSILLCAVTVVGIPLAGLMAVAYGIVLYLGYLTGAFFLGHVLFGRSKKPASAFGTLAVGVAFLFGVGFLGVLGQLVTVLVTLSGLGGLWLVLRGSGWYATHFKSARAAVPASAP